MGVRAGGMGRQLSFQMPQIRAKCRKNSGKTAENSSKRLEKIWSLKLQDYFYLEGRNLYSTFYAKNFIRRLSWSISILQPCHHNSL